MGGHIFLILYLFCSSTKLLVLSPVPTPSPSSSPEPTETPPPHPPQDLHCQVFTGHRPSSPPLHQFTMVSHGASSPSSTIAPLFPCHGHRIQARHVGPTRGHPWGFTSGASTFNSVAILVHPIHHGLSD